MKTSRKLRHLSSIANEKLQKSLKKIHNICPQNKLTWLIEWKYSTLRNLHANLKTPHQISVAILIAETSCSEITYFDDSAKCLTRHDTVRSHAHSLDNWYRNTTTSIISTQPKS